MRPTSSVVRKTVPAKPFAIRVSTWPLVSSSITGGPGIAIRTIETSSWPGGPTVSQRKSPSSGRVTSARTSIPTLSVQNPSASSWSWTQSCALAIFIIGSPSIEWELTRPN